MKRRRTTDTPKQRRRSTRHALTTVLSNDDIRKRAEVSRVVSVTPQRELAEAAMKRPWLKLYRQARKIVKRLGLEDRDIPARLSIPELLAIAPPGKPRRKLDLKTVALLEASAKLVAVGRPDHRV